MSTLIQLLDRPVAYQPSFANLRAGKVKSGPVAAVFLSQLVYWHNRMDGGWIYKTQAEINQETQLTRDEQETARKRLVALGVLEEARRGVPATMHFRIVSDRLEALLVESVNDKKQTADTQSGMGDCQNVETPQSRMGHRRKLDRCIAANKNVETPQSSLVEPCKQACGDPANFLTEDYTENTQEITQEISSSQNSGESSDAQSKSDFLSKHPDAVVCSPKGNKWGTQQDLDCAGWIFSRIQELCKKLGVAAPKQPNWTDWANDVRLMREIDGHSHRDICALFKRANQDAFWCKNVLSPRKLRERWDELTLKLSGPGGAAGTSARKELDWDGTAWADKLIQEGIL